MLTVDVDQAAKWRSLKDQLAAADDAVRAELLFQEAARHRADNLRLIAAAKLGHVGGDMSVTDILTVLYNHVMNIDPEAPTGPGRDRLVLSKGHTAGALYTVLAHCGFFSKDELATFMKPLSALNGHPNRLKVPGVEANTGPLGHGLPIALGAALASRLTGEDYRVFVITGDGELQEGSNWEAFMSAAHYRVSNLTAIIDRNRLQQGARTEETNALDPLDAKLAAFGWEVRVVDGHDHLALIEALAPSTTGQPVAVIAQTVKGKGISFMEDRVEWHHKVPSDEQVAQALEELS